MGKEEYLRRLARLIVKLPDADRAAVLNFYRETLENRIAGGMSEAGAVAELGDVRALAQKILAENPARKPVNYGKVALIVGGCSLAVLVVTICVLLVGVGLNVYGDVKTNVRANAEEKTEALEDGRGGFSFFGETLSEEKTFTVPAKDAEKIVFDVRRRDIRLEPGDGEEIIVTYRDSDRVTHSAEFSDGTLSVTSSRTGAKWWDNLGDRGSWNEGHVIVVKVPKTFAGSLRLESEHGDIEVSEYTTEEKIELYTSMGTVSLSDSSCGAARLDSSMGDVIVKGVTVGGKAEFLTDMGDIELSDVTVEGRAECINSMGEVELNRLLCPDILLENNMGDISGSIVGREEDFTVDADAGMGDSSLKERNGGTNKLEADTSMGDIDLYFTE